MTNPEDNSLRNAILAHQAGRLTEAEVGYRRTLRKRPGEAKALYGLGLLEFHRGAVSAGIELVSRCLEHAPGDARAWNTLGSMYRAAKDAAGAQHAYRRATEAAPQMSEAWYNLGLCLRDGGDVDAAVEALRKATACPEPFHQAYDAFASLQYQRGQTAEAAEAFKAWAAREPGNPVAIYMTAATSGQNVPSRASDGYVKSHFDAAADTFDANLKQLGYRAPATVAAALMRSAARLARTPAGDARCPFDTVLDAGCGTGLGGPLLRPACRRLVGIDLSPRMLGHAKSRGCYDELLIAELVTYLRSLSGSIDAVVCTDTLVYFGALHEPFAAVKSALRHSGVFIFTVEALKPGDVEDHRLQPSGRYAHSESYLRRTLAAAGFDVEAISAETLREELSQPVGGYLVTARRQVGT
jgi:predicted TPR repeat methyltransferase